MKLLVSIDDGDAGDPLIADLLEKHGLSGIFYIPWLRTHLSKGQIRDLYYRGHEIGGHTMTHPSDMKLLSTVDLEWEIVESKKILEEIIQDNLKSFCYPRGRYNDEVATAVERAGYEWARTTKVFDTSPPQDKFKTGTAIHFFPGRPEYKERDLMDLSREYLEIASKKDDGVFHLWMHYAEIERLQLWQKLDEILGLMATYKTNEDLRPEVI